MSRRERTQHIVGFRGMRPDRMSRWHTVMDLNFKENCSHGERGFADDAER